MTTRRRRPDLVAQAAPAAQPRESRAGSRSESRTPRLVLLTAHHAEPSRERIVARVTPPEAPRVESPRPEPRRPRESESAAPRAVRYAFGNPGFHYGSGYDIYRMHIGADPSASERGRD